MRKSAALAVGTNPARTTVLDTGAPLSANRPEGGRREYLTEDDVNRLIAAARRGSNGDRDAAMILTCYTHGLRVSELINLQWRQIDLDAGRIEVIRLKGSETGFSRCAASRSEHAQAAPGTTVRQPLRVHNQGARADDAKYLL